MGVEETEAEKEETKKMKEAEREEIKKMKVERGKPENIDQDAVKKKLEDEEYRLRVMMVKKKHKGLYKSMMKARKKRVNESKQLERKRKIHDDKKVENPIAATTVPKNCKKQKSQE